MYKLRVGMCNLTTVGETYCSYILCFKGEKKKKNTRRKIKKKKKKGGGGGTLN